MASKEKLRIRIAEIIQRPKNVDFKEIVWVLERLNSTCRDGRHGVIYRIPGCQETLMLNRHNDGKSHLPQYCVTQFRDRMIELELYGQDVINDESA